MENTSKHPRANTHRIFSPSFPDMMLFGYCLQLIFYLPRNQANSCSSQYVSLLKRFVTRRIFISNSVLFFTFSLLLCFILFITTNKAFFLKWYCVGKTMYCVETHQCEWLPGGQQTFEWTIHPLNDSNSIYRTEKRKKMLIFWTSCFFIGYVCDVPFVSFGCTHKSITNLCKMYHIKPGKIQRMNLMFVVIVVINCFRSILLFYFCRQKKSWSNEQHARAHVYS